MTARLKRTFKEKKTVKVVKALSTKNSTLVHVHHKAAVVFLRKVDEVEFYYKGFKYNFPINNDKEYLPLGEKKIIELLEKYLKINGEKVLDKNGIEKVKGRKKKLKEIEVKEKKKRGRPKKVA